MGWGGNGESGNGLSKLAFQRHTQQRAADFVKVHWVPPGPPAPSENSSNILAQLCFARGPRGRLSGVVSDLSAYLLYDNF